MRVLIEMLEYAPVAQLDRAHAYEAWGRAFESLRVRIISVFQRMPKNSSENQ
jgi:hypothetical protein